MSELKQRTINCDRMGALVLSYRRCVLVSALQTHQGTLLHYLKFERCPSGHAWHGNGSGRWEQVSSSRGRS